MREYLIWLAKVLTIVVVLVIVVPLLLSLVGVATKTLVSDQAVKVTAKGVEKVAVIELNGIILSSKEVLRQLYKQADNDKVQGIVLRIDSPGGAVGPSQEIYAAVRKLKSKKPIVVSMGAVAASGGFYSALGASKIFCQPGTLTGSIGVILEMPNLTKLADKVGFEMNTVKSGKLKDVGNTFRTMSEEDRKFLQQTVDQVQADFVQAVVEGRGLPEKEVLRIADGRVIPGSEALRLKLVDGYGDTYEAAREIFNILGKPLPEGEVPDLVYSEEGFDKLRKLIEGVSELPTRALTDGLYQGYNIKYLM